MVVFLYWPLMQTLLMAPLNKFTLTFRQEHWIPFNKGRERPRARARQREGKAGK